MTRLSLIGAAFVISGAGAFSATLMTRPLPVATIVAPARVAPTPAARRLAPVVAMAPVESQDALYADAVDPGDGKVYPGLAAYWIELDKAQSRLIGQGNGNPHKTTPAWLLPDPPVAPHALVVNYSCAGSEPVVCKGTLHNASGYDVLDALTLVMRGRDAQGVIVDTTAYDQATTLPNGETTRFSVGMNNVQASSVTVLRVTTTLAHDQEFVAHRSSP